MPVVCDRSLFRFLILYFRILPDLRISFIWRASDTFCPSSSLRVIEALFRIHDPKALSSHRSFDSQTYDGRGDASARKPEELRDGDGRNNGQVDTRRKRRERRPEWRLQPSNTARRMPAIFARRSCLSRRADAHGGYRAVPERWHAAQSGA